MDSSTTPGSGVRDRYICVSHQGYTRGAGSSTTTLKPSLLPVTRSSSILLTPACEQILAFARHWSARRQRLARIAVAEEREITSWRCGEGDCFRFQAAGFAATMDGPFPFRRGSPLVIRSLLRGRF